MKLKDTFELYDIGGIVVACFNQQACQAVVNSSQETIDISQE